MLLLELLQDFGLLLLVAGRLALLLLPLVVHHLLHHAPRLSVEVAQLAVLGLDLGGIDLGRSGDNVGPPLKRVDLVEVDGDLRAGAGRGQRPGGVVDADGVGELALEDALAQAVGRHGSAVTHLEYGLLALDAGLDGIACNVDVKVLALVLGVDGDGDVEVLDGLVPLVGQRGLLCLLSCAGLGVGPFALLGGR